jgi:hypothetical protein
MKENNLKLRNEKMGKRKIKVFSLLAIAIVTASGCKPVEKAPSLDTIKEQKAIDSTQRIQHSNFDLKSKALPKDIVFNDPALIVKSLAKLNKTKDQYETSAQYSLRLKEMGGTVLYDNVSLSGGFIFKLWENQANFQYDADKQELKATFNPDLNRNYGSDSTWSMLLVSSVGLNPSGSDYLTGIKDYYKSREYKDISLQENTYLNLVNKKYEYGQFVVKVKVSPDAAKLLEKKLAVVLIGNCVPPFLNIGETLPSEYNDSVYKRLNKIEFSIKNIWLIDSESKEIISKDWSYKTL